MLSILEANNKAQRDQSTLGYRQVQAGGRETECTSIVSDIMVIAHHYSWMWLTNLFTNALLTLLLPLYHSQLRQIHGALIFRCPPYVVQRVLPLGLGKYLEVTGIEL